jgi:hypothetical protein
MITKIIWKGPVFENDKCFQLFADEFDTDAFILEKKECIKKSKQGVDQWEFQFNQDIIQENQYLKLFKSNYCLYIGC